MKLRPYQSDCIQATYDWLYSQADNPLNVLCTGTGKSVIIAQLIKTIIQQYPDTRILCCIDTKELIRQNYETLISIWPFAPAGVCSAGLKRKDTGHQILFTGIQSVWNKADIIGDVDILIVDEAHMLSTKPDSTWQKFIKALKPTRIIGYTATPYRMDSGLIHTGEDAVFGGIAYEYNIKQALADGYLTEIIPKTMATKFDVSGVKKNKGEFIESQLQGAINIAEKNIAVIDEIEKYGQDRKAWLLFGAGCGHCEQLHGILRRRGYEGAVILGDTPSGERDKAISDFKKGKLRYLVNNAVLTKGFDAPHIDLLAAVRPTLSPVLWTQMIGRGLRLVSGSIGNIELSEGRKRAIEESDKPNCLLLDFAENIPRFGFIDDMKFKDKKMKEGEGVPPMKTCDDCEAIVHAGVRECPFCGFKFPAPEPSFNEESYGGAVLSTQVVAEWKNVKKVYVSSHKGNNKPHAVLKVEYLCEGFERFYEWICFDHPLENYARISAIRWWKKNADGYRIKDFDLAAKWLDMNGIPKSVKQAIEFQEAIIVPKAIKVKQIKENGNFWKVLGRELLSPEEESQRKQQELDDQALADEISF